MPGPRDRGAAGPLQRLALGDEEAERQIIDRYIGGLSLREAGVPFGAGRGAVTAVLDRHGVARRRVGRPRRAVPTAAVAAASGGDRWLGAGEVAAALGVSKRTTYRLIRSGELEAVRVSSRGLRVRESVLRAYLRSRQAPLPGAVAAVFGDGDGAPYLRAGPVIIPLDGEVTKVGRGADCGVRLDDPSVALLHAEVACRGSCVHVTSLAGPIGETRVNGQVVTRQVLVPGDVISFGKVSCTVGGLAAPDPERLPASTDGEANQRAGRVEEGPAVR